MGRVTEAQLLQARVDELERTLDAEVALRVSTTLEAVRITSASTDLFAGLTPEQIRAKAVSIAMGPQAVDGASRDAIEARFDHLAEKPHEDPVRAAMLQHRRSVN